MADARILFALSLASFALAALVGASVLFWQQFQRDRSERRLNEAILGQSASDPVVVAALDPGDGDGLPHQANADLPVHWLDTRLGHALVAAEDRRLIDQAGLPAVRTQWAYLVARLALAAIFPLAALLLWGEGKGFSGLVTLGSFALAAGFMLPKWAVRRRARQRSRAAAHELPLFIDLLRLLQGVGLSMDQSLQVIGNDFQHVLKVLGAEVAAANRQYAQGRTREHSLQRLATLHDSENLANLVSLLVQVDRHGGAVQEPLKQYGERLREHRRASMKAHIGKVTVKMTGVMVLTLLPALLLITAGPGFLAVIHSLGAFGK